MTPTIQEQERKLEAREAFKAMLVDLMEAEPDFFEIEVEAISDGYSETKGFKVSLKLDGVTVASGSDSHYMPK